MGIEYLHLRGLLSVPLGALMVVAALGNWQWGPWRREWFVLACALVLAALALLIWRHYNQRFGRVTTSARQDAVIVATTAATGFVTFAGSLLLRSTADWSLDLPVNSLAAALAAALLAYYVTAVGPKAHHLLTWGSLLVIGFLPVWGNLDLADTSNVALVLAGIAATASGVADHLYLGRSLGSARGLGLTPGDNG